MSGSFDRKTVHDVRNSFTSRRMPRDLLLRVKLMVTLAASSSERREPPAPRSPFLSLPGQILLAPHPLIILALNELDSL